MKATTIEIAQQAFDYLAQGWATGNFQPFIEMLTEDVVFWLPVGKQQDKSLAYEDKQQILARLQARTAVGNCLRFSPPDHVTSNDTSITFEFESEGTIYNQPYKGRNIISFDLRGEKIAGIREYFGDID